VGREAELGLAAAAVRQLSERRASALAIEGEAGIGKTRLVQSIVDDARSCDVAVFCGRAHPFERTRPFGVVAAALDLSRRSPDPRRAAIGALLAGQGAGAPERAAGDIRYRVVEEIVDLVETSCAERPVLLVAEDIHWADSASLLAILSVARLLPLAALLVVVTARPSPLPAEAGLTGHATVRWRPGRSRRAHMRSAAWPDVRPMTSSTISTIVGTDRAVPSAGQYAEADAVEMPEPHLTGAGYLGSAHAALLSRPFLRLAYRVQRDAAARPWRVRSAA
jgi:hypothetical protein